MNDPDAILACQLYKHPVGYASFSPFEDCVAKEYPRRLRGGRQLVVRRRRRAQSSDQRDDLRPPLGERRRCPEPRRAGTARSRLRNHRRELRRPAAAHADGDDRRRGHHAGHGADEATDEGNNGFLGFFEVTNPVDAGESTYLPTLAIPGFALTQNGFSQPFVSFTLAEADSLAKAVGHQAFNPTLGYALLTSVDCADAPAAGVVFDVENISTTVLYTFDGLPPSPSANATDSSGTAVMAFAPPGEGIVVAKNAAGLVVSKTSFFLRAGALSVVLAPVNQ